MTDTAPYQAIYTVRAGDSLAKIAAAFFGDARKYVFIAEANGLDPMKVLPIGTQLKIPPPDAVVSHQLAETTMTLPAPEIGPEEVVVTATRLPQWYEDWRLWAGGAALLLLYMYMKEHD